VSWKSCVSHLSSVNIIVSHKIVIHFSEGKCKIRFHFWIYFCIIKFEL
jgi:hypothetical protein